VPDDPAHGAQPSRFSLARLWIVVSLLWSLATLVRLGEGAVPALGWGGVLRDRTTGAALLLPPVLLAVLLAAIEWVWRNAARSPRKPLQ